MLLLALGLATSVATAGERLPSATIACYLGGSYCSDSNVDHVGVVGGVRATMKVHPHLGIEVLDVGYLTNQVRFGDIAMGGAPYLSSSAVVYLLRGSVSPYLIGGIGAALCPDGTPTLLATYGGGIEGYFAKRLGLRFDLRQRRITTTATVYHGDNSWGWWRSWVEHYSQQWSPTELSVGLVARIQ